MHLTAGLVLLVRLYDTTGLTVRDIDTSRRVAADILRHSGIDVAWVDCGRPGASRPERDQGCTDWRPEPTLVVRMSGLPASKSQGNSLDDAYVDVGAGEGTLATLYVERIQAWASRVSVDAGIMIGRTMAHEIGHLLLGTSSHAPTGLMRASWPAALVQRGFGRDWLFSSAEGATLRSHLRRRSLRDQRPPLPADLFVLELPVQPGLEGGEIVENR